MRQIKFRGRDSRGNVFFGCYDESTATIDDFEYAACHVVEPESVAQFVGLDADGNEVYEGDILIDEQGLEWEAQLRPTDLRGLKLIRHH